MITEPSYLGDGVYISPGRYSGEIIITTGHHDPEEADNVVYLEPAVVRALQKAITTNE